MALYTPTEGTDMTKTAQRVEVIPFMETAADTWEQMGDGWTKFTENPGAQTKTKRFINATDETETTTSYKRKFDFECDLRFNSPSIKKVYDIATEGKIGSNALVTVVVADMFGTAVSGAYPARKFSLAVAVSNLDGEDEMKMSGSFNGQGDAVKGTFNPTTGVFTADV